MLLCIQLFITTVSALNAAGYHDWYAAAYSKVDFDDISSIYFASPTGDSLGLSSDYSDMQIIVGFDSNKTSIVRFYLTNDVEKVVLTNNYIEANQGLITYYSIQYDNTSQTYQFGTGSLPESKKVNYTFSELIYSSVDIYDVDGKLMYEHSYGAEDYQSYYAPNIDVTYYPELSLDMDFSYENPGGSRDEYGRPIPSIEYNYNVTGTVDYNGSWTYQFCVLVSEAPPEVVFEEGINPTQDKYYVDFKSYKENSIFTVCQDTYYWCTYNNPNYGDIDFVQAKGVIGWFVASPGKDSHFTLNLQRVPGFSPDKTYYITLWGYERPEGETATFTYLPAAYSFDEIETQGHSIQLVDCQAFGTTKALVDYEDTSHKNKFTQSDNSYVDFTGTGDNLFNGGIIPESAVHTPTTDGITGPITSIKPNNDSNLSDSFTIGEFSLMGLASQFLPFLTASLSILPEPIGGILQFSTIAVLACCLVAVLFKLLSKLLG